MYSFRKFDYHNIYNYNHIFTTANVLGNPITDDVVTDAIFKHFFLQKKIKKELGITPNMSRETVFFMQQFCTCTSPLCKIHVYITTENPFSRHKDDLEDIFGKHIAPGEKLAVPFAFIQNDKSFWKYLKDIIDKNHIYDIDLDILYTEQQIPALYDFEETSLAFKKVINNKNRNVVALIAKNTNLE